MMVIKIVLRILLVLCFSIFDVAAQQVTSETKYADIFKEWSEKTGPGVAAGAIYKGEVVFLKGFGNAEPQNNSKITPQTKFQIDDLSKQFTILAAFILESEGKISLEEDIRKYIPSLPKYDETILVKHLLNHTSGLHDLEVLKQLKEYDQEARFTQEDALKLIRTQKILDFKPGTDFSYFTSNTELVLLAELVAKASGLSFVDFTTQYIFEPLQMNNTEFNNSNKVLSNVALPYRGEKEVEQIPKSDFTLGPSNLYTSAEDLAKWYLIFTNPTANVGKLVKKLETYVTLDSGGTLNSTWGIMTLGRDFGHLERGIPLLWQYGLVDGYASNVFRFHAEDFTSFAIGNNTNYNGRPAMELAHKLLEKEFTEPPLIDFSKINWVKVPTNTLQEYEGYYWNNKRGLSRRIILKNDSLKYFRNDQDPGTPMLAHTKNKFQFVAETDNTIVVVFDKEEGAFKVYFNNSDESVYRKYKPASYLASELNEFAGLFYNDELEVAYTFSIENEILVAESLKTEKIEFHPVTQDLFRSGSLKFAGIQFLRDDSQNIIGFAVNTDGVRDIQFRRI